MVNDKKINQSLNYFKNTYGEDKKIKYELEKYTKLSHDIYLSILPYISICFIILGFISIFKITPFEIKNIAFTLGIINILIILLLGKSKIQLNKLELLMYKEKFENK